MWDETRKGQIARELLKGGICRKRYVIQQPRRGQGDDASQARERMDTPENEEDRQ